MLAGEPSNIVRWELAALAKSHGLDEGEILCEAEEVMADESLGGLGALFVTDLRVLFVRTGVVRHETEIVSVQLEEIAEVQPSASKLSWPFGRNRGALTLKAIDDGSETQLVFDRIPGGVDRANEIARTIIRQRQLLEAQAPGERQSSDTTALSESSDVSELITIGPGVVKYVNSHGGRLYVWGDPVGGFEWMKASTDPPQSQHMVLVEGIRDFELFIEKDLELARRLRLARRWWVPRGGIVVDTGLSSGT